MIDYTAISCGLISRLGYSCFQWYCRDYSEVVVVAGCSVSLCDSIWLVYGYRLLPLSLLGGPISVRIHSQPMFTSQPGIRQKKKQEGYVRIYVCLWRLVWDEGHVHWGGNLKSEVTPPEMPRAIRNNNIWCSNKTGMPRKYLDGNTHLWRAGTLD